MDPTLKPFRLAGFAGLWTVVGVFFAVQVYLDYQYVGQPIRFGQAVYLALSDWYIWALASPLILWVARRAPLERDTWLRSLMVHLPFTLVLTLVKTWAEHAFVQATAPGIYRPPTMAKLNGSLLTCWLIVVICHALIQYRASRDRRRRALHLERELSRAQLQLLKIQLSPHFLFNTLHSIGTLMHRDVGAAEEMLTQLSDLLRSTLENGERQWVSLKEELEFVNLYLKIQQTRFRERLSVEVEVDADALDIPVPSMILQPLVENAVAHGVAPRTRGGAIGVHASLSGERLVLRVTDDGPGPPGDAPLRDGIGLGNTRTRLAHLYGDNHTLRLEAGEEGGFEVRLSLPIDAGDRA